MLFEMAFVLLFTVILLYFVKAFKKNNNFYIRYGQIILCIGISARILLLGYDVVYRLFVNPIGMLDNPWVVSHKEFIDDTFIYNANICFYFTYFAVACDWAEVFLTFKLIDSMDEQQFYRIRKKLQTFFLVFLITFIALYVGELFLRLFQATFERILTKTGYSFIFQVFLIVAITIQASIWLTNLFLFLAVVIEVFILRKKQKEMLEEISTEIKKSKDIKQQNISESYVCDLEFDKKDTGFHLSADNKNKNSKTLD